LTGTGYVGILDSQDKLSLVMPGEKIIVDGGSGSAHMQETGWAGSHSDSNFAHTIEKVTVSRLSVGVSATYRLSSFGFVYRILTTND
jgi:hypothetical protein